MPNKECRREKGNRREKTQKHVTMPLRRLEWSPGKLLGEALPSDG
jgi:hypothetical protein